jgi:hypothetical protein
VTYFPIVEALFYNAENSKWASSHIKAGGKVEAASNASNGMVEYMAITIDLATVD